MGQGEEKRKGREQEIRGRGNLKPAQIRLQRKLSLCRNYIAEHLKGNLDLLPHKPLGVVVRV